MLRRVLNQSHYVGRQTFALRTAAGVPLQTNQVTRMQAKAFSSKNDRLHFSERECRDGCKAIDVSYEKAQV